MKKTLVLILAALMVFSAVSFAAAEDEPIKLYFVSRSLGLSGTEDTAIVDFLEEKFNVDITWEVIPSTNYQQITRNMVAAGPEEWPDLMEYQDSSKKTLEGFVEDGMLTPLKALLEEYGQNLLAIRNEEGYWYPIEDEYYIIPIRYNLPETFVTIRQDWLDKLGLSMPHTLEEMIEVATAFTFNDPDGNGINDTYGFGGPLDGNFWDIMMPIMASFGITYNSRACNAKIYDEEFKYVPYKMDPLMKECIRFFRDNVYLKGLCDPDFLVYKRQDYLNAKNTDKYGIEYWYLTHTNSGWYDTFIEAVPHAVLAAMPLCDYEGYEKAWPRTVGFPQLGGFNLYIPTSCEHPELVIQILNYLASDEGNEMVRLGIEGKTYTKDEAGNITILDYDAETAAAVGVDEYHVFWTDYYKYNNCQLLQDGLAEVSPYLHAARDENWTYDGDTSALGNILNSYLTTMMTDGDVDIDEMWQQMCEEYYDMGGAEYLRWYNEQIIEHYGEDAQ